MPKYAGNLPRYLLFQALIGCYLWMPIWVLFMQERGLSLSQVGTLDAVGWVLMALAEVPTGAIADRYGRKVSLALGALLYGIAMFTVAAKVTSPIFLFGYLLWTTSNTLFSGADTAFLFDTLAADGRQAEFERYSGRANAIAQGSMALGSLVGAWLASFNMLLCFLIAGGLSLLAAGVALTFREPPAVDAAHVGDGKPTFMQTIRSALQIVVERPAARFLIIFGALVPVFSFLLTSTLFQPYAAAIHLPVSALGIVVLLNRGAAILGSGMAHLVSRKVGNAVLIVGWPVSLILIQLLLAAVPSWPALGLFMAAALGAAIVRPTISGALNRYIPSGQRATVLSLQSLLWTLTLAVVEPIVMGVGSKFGMPPAIGVAGLMLALLLIPLGLFWQLHARSSAVDLAPGTD